MRHFKSLHRQHDTDVINTLPVTYGLRELSLRHIHWRLVGVEISSHIFLTTVLEVRYYFHVPTIFAQEKRHYTKQGKVCLRANLQIKKKKATTCLWPWTCKCHIIHSALRWGSEIRVFNSLCHTTL